MSEFIVELVPCDSKDMAIVRPSGSIDAAAAPVLEAHFRSISDKGIRNIVVDFQKTEFISSAGIGVFLGTVSLMRETGGDIYFLNLPPNVDEIFELINLKSFFKTIQDISEMNNLVQS